MGRVNGHTAEQVITSVRKCHGLLAAVARDLSVDRTTVYRYVKNFPTIAQAVQEERDAWTDLAEQQLLASIQKGNLQAVMFFLKTVGKNRGYTERTEITGAEGGPLTIKVKDVGTI